MYEGKNVLGIGDVAGTLKLALEQGAALVEGMPLGKNETDPSVELVKWPGRRGAKGVVQLRAGTGANLEDSEEWDVIVLDWEFASLLDLKAIYKALKPDGMVVVPRGKGLPPEVVVEDPGLPEKAVMLHVHNVRRCGGTGNFVYDLARCFPQWQHTALCVNDAAGDQNWINDVAGTMRTMYSPKLTKAILDEVNPRILVLHSTVGNKLEGEWPFNWLQAGGKRYVVAYHHTATYPLLPADLDVFVSKYIEGRYANLFGRMKKRIVLPPCTNMAPYQALARLSTGPSNNRLTTCGKACPEMQNLIPQLGGEWSIDSSPPGRIGQFAKYLGGFDYAVVWSGLKETWCRTVSEAMAAGCVTLAHRAGAIPEQIIHGENGYLFDTGAELVKLLDELRDGKGVSKVRQAQVAQAGRDWAVENVGYERLQRELLPHLLSAALETP